MKAKTILRLSIVPVLIKLLGHSIGHAGWDKPEDPKMQTVVDSMKGYTGQFMGASYNMAEYYTGYSIMIIFVYLLSAYLLWKVSGFITEHKKIAISLIYAIGIFYLVAGILEFRFFFPFAASMSILTGILCFWAILTGRRQ